jgi:hypothetical protein
MESLGSATLSGLDGEPRFAHQSRELDCPFGETVTPYVQHAYRARL